MIYSCSHRFIPSSRCDDGINLSLICHDNINNISLNELNNYLYDISEIKLL